MSTQLCENIIEVLNDSGGGGGGCVASVDATKASIAKVLAQMKRFQERVRKHIDDNYVEFMPNHTSSDLFLDEGETLVREAEHLLKTAGGDTGAALHAANVELADCIAEFREVSLGLRLSNRILKVDDLFQCVEEANATKEYLIVLDLLGKLKSLICSEAGTEVDRIFQRCECYDTIKVKYHVQANILQQNLQQRFERLVQISEKNFANAKCVTLQVSKDVNQLQDTVMALFQARFNPIKLCDFLLGNCFEPLIVKPVSLEYSEDNAEYTQLTLSFSLKELSSSLRPSYKQVFENIKMLLHCLGNINVSVSVEHHVFSIIGDHIKQRLLALLVDDCLMHAIPETMDEFQESTLVEDVLQFEQCLADTFLISAESDRALFEFTEQFEIYFCDRFSNKLLESARDIMQKDLQDMTVIAEKNTVEDVDSNPFLFPRCMVSKSSLEIVKLMERILRQPHESDSEDSEHDNLLNVITVILNAYLNEMPKLHEKLLESIPQQSVLFYNNCMFLSHWVATNAEKRIPTFPALVKALQATGIKYLNVQIAYQQKIIMGIMREFDVSDAHTLGAAPLKLIRQCLRQLDLLRNVWQNVLSDSMYNKTFCNLLHDLCSELIRRILAMEDISATVANELGELITVILEKAPTLFKEKHQVVHIKSWMKLEQLKMILNASLQEITEQWCEGAGILTANYKAEEVKHLIRALFQNTDRRAKALTKII